MKLFKKVACIVMASIITIGSANCTTVSAAKNLSVKEVITSMQEVSNEIKDFDATMKMDMQMESEGTKVDFAMKGNIIAFSDPLKMKMKTTMDMGTLGSMDMDMYYAMEDDTLYIYQNVDGVWSKVKAMDNYSELEQYSAAANADVYAKNIKKFSIFKDNVKLKGKNTIVLKGKISGSSLEDVMENLEGLESAVGSDVVDITKAKGLKDVTVKIWVDKETMQPIKYYMDMTKYVQSILDSTVEEELAGSIKYNKVALTITYNAFGDEVKDFNIPKEALKAEEIKID